MKNKLKFEELRPGMIVITKVPTVSSGEGPRHAELTLIVHKDREKCEALILTSHFGSYTMREYVSADMEFYTHLKDQKKIEINYLDKMYFISKKNFNKFLLNFIAYNMKKCSELNESEIIKTTIQNVELLPKNFTQKALIERIARNKDSDVSTDSISPHYLSEAHYRRLRIQISAMESHMRVENYEQVTQGFTDVLSILKETQEQNIWYGKLEKYIEEMQSDMANERYNMVILKFSPLLQMIENMRKR